MLNQNTHENRIDTLMQMKRQNQITIDEITDILYNEGL